MMTKYSNNSISLFDLPIESLTNIASYLRTSSRALALFNVALAYDHHNNVKVRDLCGIRSLRSWRKQLSAVCGERWDILDFGELERDLARRLCDSDIQAVLLFFDAVHTRRKLRLSNCTNIKGSCLKPLRGSLMLEQIDLSLIGDNIGALPAPNISYRHVLQILRECSSLRHIQFPGIREIVLNRTESSFELKHFITKYNQMWKKRDNVSCSKCSTDTNVLGGNNIRWMNIFGYVCNYLRECSGCTFKMRGDCFNERRCDKNKAYCDICE